MSKIKRFALLKKTYPKSGKFCKVTFICPNDGADKVCVVGDFNQWNPAATPMKRLKNGFSATIELEPGKSYEYKFFIDDKKWVHDEKADRFAPSPYPDSQNSVVSV